MAECCPIQSFVCMWVDGMQWSTDPSNKNTLKTGTFPSSKIFYLPPSPRFFYPLPPFHLSKSILTTIQLEAKYMKIYETHTKTYST